MCTYQHDNKDILRKELHETITEIDKAIYRAEKKLCNYIFPKHRDNENRNH